MAKFSPYVCMQTTSKCYKNTIRIKPVGVLWHSTGANNPFIKRYVQPTDGSINYAKDIEKLGKNAYRNDWNHLQVSAGVNAFIGKFNDGTIGTVQALPWDYAPWGCGSGKNGSCNYMKQNGSYIGWIQFEICEDGLTDKNYAQQVYNEALNLTAYLCKLYNINPNGTVKVNGVNVPTILCHNDAYKLGFGTGHSDINHWFPKILGKDMSDARAEVSKLVSSNTIAKVSNTTTTSKTTTTSSTVLKRGSKGTAVRTLQTNLNKIINAKLTVDGAFGAKTETAVKNFQKKYGLTVDGIYGPASEAKMITALKSIKTGTTASKTTTKEYKIKVNVGALNVRKEPNGKINTVIRLNEIYTIVEEKNGWGKLKSGQGWIMLKYTKKL